MNQSSKYVDFGPMKSMAGAILSSRRTIILLAAGVALSGIAFNWTWLSAIGVAPVLVAVLPCVVMCGLGLCMNKVMGGKCSNLDISAACEKQTSQKPAIDTTRG